MSNGDVWGTTSTTVTRSSEGTSEARRCVPCSAVFSRPQGSALTHRQVDDSVSCPEDGDVTTIQKANRWKRK